MNKTTISTLGMLLFGIGITYALYTPVTLQNVEEAPAESEAGHDRHEDQKDAPDHANSEDGKHEDKGGHAHGEKEENGESVTLSAGSAASAGVKTAEAGSENIRETIRLTGRTTLNQNTTAHVKARFPGIVSEVRKAPGDVVGAGDVLAMVESNESLQLYPVKSPINGTVLSRNTNVGDVAGDAPMFTIADTSDIWVEFHIFPRDIQRIQTGQAVMIASVEGQITAEAPIVTLLPVAEASSQTVLARVTLPNPQGMWRAGMAVRGDVVVSERTVPVAVSSSSIQRFEGNMVVFVQDEGRYAARTIKPGASDSQWTEVLDGLKAGEQYVNEKSFQIKADIGKAGAAHEH